MISVALIVFREVLEAALLVGVVLAATHGIARRTHWILVGIGVGLLGALIVAGATEQLAAAAEGMGQELFNACVLFAAVLMLGWHTLWMRSHARQITQSTRTLAQEVSAGRRPLYAIATVIALAVVREGSEVVLFLQGISASGTTNTFGMLVGSALGLCGGLTMGAAVAVGLLRIPTRHLFAVTSGLLALLAAGMAAQGTSFLVQAGYISFLTSTAWDTSSVVADRSLLGQILHALIGYTASPMVIQVIAYGITLGLLGIALYRDATHKPTKPTRASRGFLILAWYATSGLLCTHTSNATADLKVYSPYVELGEWEFEFRGLRSFDRNPAKDDAQNYLYEIGYSPLAWWHASVFLEDERQPGESLNPTEFALENIFQLTEPGEFWLDAGAYVEYSKGLERGGDHALEWKILLEKQIGNWTIDANPIFVQEFTDSGNPGVQFEYAWGTYYRFRPEFEPGFEAFGAIGELTNANPINAQDHMLGPVARGRFNLGPNSKLKYNVGYLFGLTDEAPNGTVKVELEYELRF